MGCDIHMYVEYKTSINGEMKWLNGDYWKLNKYHADEGEKKFELVELCGDRDYTLFGMLADVRRHDNEPISQPKGLPRDISETVSGENYEWGSDGHSHSYIDLAELKKYMSKVPTIKYSGMISPEQSKKLDEGIVPTEWWVRTNQADYVNREWETENKPIKNLINLMEDRKNELFWLRRDKERPEFDEKIRIVFWFDN